MNSLVRPFTFALLATLGSLAAAQPPPADPLAAQAAAVAAGGGEAPAPGAAGMATPSPAGAAAGAAPVAGAAAGTPAPAFDPEQATRAYLDRLPAEQKARSDAYFEGGYWLQLWGFLYGLGVAWLLLATGLSARLRDLAGRASRFRPLRNALYAALYILAATVLGFPLAVYDDFFREHHYDLSNQTFGEWLTDQAKGLLVGVVLGSLLLAALYGVLRRAPRTWWAWGSVVSVLFLAFTLLIAPVYIDPLFNEYTRLDDPRVRDPILRMAQANGVPVQDVWVFDASKQSKRISANVSGLFGTESIRLNDNLLERTSLPEIEAVMGHELGHYVLNHIYEGLIELGLLLVGGFLFLRFAFERVRARWGHRWGVTGIDDPAGLPLIAALFAVYFFALTPVVNTIIRVNEAEADLYGLNTARQPEGFAEVALKLGEYRKLEPGPLEELIFFDHPSGRSRILMAMRWQAAQPGATAPGGTTASPLPVPGATNGSPAGAPGAP